MIVVFEWLSFVFGNNYYEMFYSYDNFVWLLGLFLKDLNFVLWIMF